MSNLPQSFLGVGLAYPRQLDATNSRPLIASNDALIKMSMEQIIKTNVGERPFLMQNGVPFGTRIRTALFQDSLIAQDIIQYEIGRALILWEPRIIYDSTQTNESPTAEGGVDIIAMVFFRYRSTNRPDNFVTPFRLVRSFP